MHIFYIMSQVINYWIKEPPLPKSSISISSTREQEPQNYMWEPGIPPWKVTCTCPGGACPRSLCTLWSASEWELWGSSGLRALRKYWATVIFPYKEMAKPNKEPLRLLENYVSVGFWPKFQQWKLGSNSSNGAIGCHDDGRFVALAYSPSPAHCTLHRISLQVTEL